MAAGSFSVGRAQELFDEFVSASTCRAALWSFGQLCDHLHLDKSTAERPLYRPIKRRLNYWRANALWAKLDRRASQQEYQRARVCSNTTCVIIGAGPCGLRTAVELSFMGARVVLVEKRDSFSRNNVLHLWPFTIHDLRGLGAKKFYGKFCVGSIDHISIRQLQLILLKVALLLGVEVHVGVEFKKVLEPPEDQRTHKVGWRMEVWPKSHPVSQLEFDVIIGADGRRNTLPGFRRKEFRGKLAIAITANFKNRNTSAEAKVEEISGVASIFNQRFFQELQQETGINLENIVYYKDDTHYFVMTAKKQSLLEKGVILQDFTDTELLLSPGNVDQHALQMFARQAADFSTNHQLPSLDFAMNHYGQPDVAMFDFTCMYASENAAMIRQRHGSQLLVALVGDSLLEPFWPMGTGIARGFLAALDLCWMIRSLSQGRDPLDVLSERESVYRLLPQTTPENLQKNFNLFTVDPATRYGNINCLLVTPVQVRHLVDTGEDVGLNHDSGDIIQLPSPRFFRVDSSCQSNQLLSWCQEQTSGYRGVAVQDLTTSWKSGLALCALIHRYQPDVIDFDSLDASAAEDNARLGLDVAEQEFGIAPLMTAQEMSSAGEPDSLSMVMYLSQFYQLLKDTPPPAGSLSRSSDLRLALVTPAFLLSRLGLSPSRKRNTKEQKDTRGKRRKSSAPGGGQQESCDLSQVHDEPSEGGASCSRVRLMANRLQARLDESLTSCRSSAVTTHQQQGELPAPSQIASWRPKKRTLQQQQMSFRFREKIRRQDAVKQPEQRRVYLMERLSAEGFFFHRSCFQCFQCRNALRLAAYTFDPHSGRFYCPHCCEPRLTERTVPADGASSHQTSTTSLAAAPSLSSADSLASAERRRSSALSAMLERIELENCGWSSVQGAELQEEPQNRFNLSLEDKTSSSEEELEEELEDRGSDREEFPPVSSAAGSDIVQRDTPLEPVSTSNVLSSFRPQFETPPPVNTPSTVSFITTASSAPDQDPTTGLSPGFSQTHASWQPDRWGVFDNISPEVPQKTDLLLGKWVEPEEEELKSEEVGRTWRHEEGHSYTPPLLRPSLQGGGSDLLLQLKNLRGTPPDGQAGVEMGGARALWRAVFSGNWKEMRKKKQGRDKQRTTTDVTGSPMEESDLDSWTLMRTCSLTPRNNLRLELCDLVCEIQNVTIMEAEKQNPNQELVYVPHALAFKQAYAIKKRSQKERVLLWDSDGQSSCPTEVVGVLVQSKEPSSLSVRETMFQREREDEEEDLDAKITRRVQRAARKTAKREQLKRLHKAQMVQRLLQQLEEKQRQLEERGVMVEKALRGEADCCVVSDEGSEVKVRLGGLDTLDDGALMQDWFHLVQQRNAVVRFESELLIIARELELEDRQSRLQQELRERMAVDDHLKEEWQLMEERLILEEMLEVVEQRDSLVSLLEEQRVQDRQEDQYTGLMMTQELGLGWS